MPLPQADSRMGRWLSYGGMGDAHVGGREMAARNENLGCPGGRWRILGWSFVLLSLAIGLAPNLVGDQGRAGEDGKTQEERDEKGENGAKTRHDHPAFQERVGERRRMLRRQIELRKVRDPNVLKAMRVVPRHVFIPDGQRPYAYEDRPLPIGNGQTISQPYIVAFMTEALKLDPNSLVLEIGTGSGYQAAVCAEIAKKVYTIEIVEPLAASSAKLLKQLGYRNVHVRAGDGYYGWPQKAPFDAILGTAAAEKIPPPLVEQLKKGGRMILPVGDERGFQYLILLTKDEQGRLRQKNVMPVLFVPMTGRVQQSQEESDD